MTLALLCSGQGRQHAAMFALTGQAPEAASIFAAATAALGGQDPRDLLALGEEAFHTNEAGQILCCTQALAAHAVLAATIGPEITLAGYSVGELAAWGCAGILSAEATLELARCRAAFMDRAGGPGDGLAFVRGLGRRSVDALCSRFGAAVSIVNPGDGYVIGGERARLKDFCVAATQAGASRAGLLDVHVASHTAKLAPASIEFRAALDGTKMASLPPGLHLLSGVDGEPVRDLRLGADKLAQQISQPLAWDACLESCIEAGCMTFLELGPGRALADMAAEAYPDVQARSIDEFRGFEGVRNWLTRSGHGAPSRP